MVGFFGFPEVCQTAYTNGSLDYLQLQNKEDGIEKTSSIRSSHSQEDHKILEDGNLGASSYGKRRKRIVDPSSPFNSNTNDEREQPKDLSEDSSGLRKEKGNKRSGLQGKQLSKQAKINHQSGEAPEQNYIHVRARRGQATNSHSLAERVRREKISDRMKMLQELVPGCNKTTGKAVMLDEVISYVQSLQQQVEFLSMKLATADPELNIGIEHILSKDILHYQGENSAIIGLGSGMNTSQPHQHWIPQGTIPCTPNRTPAFHHMLQDTLKPDIENV